MNQEILKTSNIYQSICMASITGRKRGISVKELKKEYNIKNRDIKSLISFLNSYDMASDILRFYYNVYKLTPHYTTQKDNLPFDNLDEEDVEEVNLDEEDIDNDTYIRIQDSVMILREKMKEENIDITNASFIHSMKDEMDKLWNKISDVKMDAGYVIIKEERAELQSDMRERKMEWIWAVIKANLVTMKYWTPETRGRKEVVLPLGMYYNRFLDKYICVYQNEQEEWQEIALDEISSIAGIEDEYRGGIHFNIYDYIKKIQTKKMVLHVYKEGKVAKKLKNLLEDNQLTVREEEEFDEFTFMTENAKQYVKTLNSYGKSVVVIEPDFIREEMIRSTREALEFYKNT